MTSNMPYKLPFSEADIARYLSSHPVFGGIHAYSIIL
jgi:hypothetical protein